MLSKSLSARLALAVLWLAVALTTGCAGTAASAGVRPAAGVLPASFQGAAAVLTYHHLSPVPWGRDTITPRLFRRQLLLLRASGYHFVSLEEVAQFYQGFRRLPPNAVAVTFDDGYESFYTYAAPVLRQLGIPATDFIIVANVDGLNRRPHIPALTWEQMRELEKTGLFRFEPHTFSSHFLVRIHGLWGMRREPALVAWVNPATGLPESISLHVRRVQADLQRARKEVEWHLGGRRTLLAWPYGAYDWAARLAAGRAGYRLVFGTKPGLIRCTSDRYDLPRINAGSPLVTPVRLALALRQAARDLRGVGMKPAVVPVAHDLH
ncbi:MAG: polysaccharide deacetylase family protein [Firmicutes bacterium]|nr:polysaccharide deacetylase family protein [Bacillota bacterium]